MIMPWSHWCRLCSKDNGCEIDIFDHKSEYDDKNETKNDAELYTIIIKYFQITFDENDDSIPKGICQDCLKFMQNLQLFSDRQVKVETMFTKLIDNKLLSIQDIDFNNIRQQYGIIDESIILKWDQSTDTTDLRVSAVKSEPNENHIYEDYQEIDGNDDDNGNDSEPLYDPVCVILKTENTCGEEEETVGNEIDQPSTAIKGIRRRKVKENNNRSGTRNRKLRSKDVEYIEDHEANKEGENNQNDDEYKDDDTNEYGSGDGEVDDNDDYIYEKEKKKSKKKRMSSPKESSPKDQQQSKPKRKRDKEDSDEKRVKKQIKCEVCEKIFSRKSTHKDHMENVHFNFECSKCGKKFPTKKRLKQHIYFHLPANEKKMIPCPFCDKRFTKASEISPHIRELHIGEKSLVCEECGKTFFTKGALKEHSYIHVDETPFECLRCHKKFKTASRLKVHEDTHNDTVYVCPHCGLKLNTRRTLNMHMVTHSDKKNFKCEYCGNEYKRAKTLKNHLILHTGLRPYTCQFCDKTFANGSNCRSHKKKSHPVEFAALEMTGEASVPTPNIPKLEQLKAVAAKASPSQQQLHKTRQRQHSNQRQQQQQSQHMQQQPHQQEQQHINPIHHEQDSNISNISNSHQSSNQMSIQEDSQHHQQQQGNDDCIGDSSDTFSFLNEAQRSAAVAAAAAAVGYHNLPREINEQMQQIHRRNIYEHLKLTLS